ncbi:hypothetical protein [Halobacterium sp. CBA1126]|uniref:hypothetical protein n=1 Tax=Halobacterium sp. CBA1126 TaxID=2668074 RepID=UPI0012FAC808|nr:hypothetical protein [Halobacterium sp. CBA1126]MUV60180.1 hypothetical protein [Halobacterium sp. CBA1126]
MDVFSTRATTVAPRNSTLAESSNDAGSMESSTPSTSSAAAGIAERQSLRNDRARQRSSPSAHGSSAPAVTSARSGSNSAPACDVVSAGPPCSKYASTRSGRYRSVSVGVPGTT